MRDEKPETEEIAEEPEGDVDPGPPPAQDYGKVVYIKKDVGAKLTKGEIDAISDADVVIQDSNVQIIVKNREGVVGVLATPDLVEQAEVIE